MTNPIDFWVDATPSKEEVHAINAVVRGEATEGQQRIAMKWILHRACCVGVDTFHPDPYTSAHRQGRRAAGLLIASLLVKGVPEDSPDNEAPEKLDEVEDNG